MQYVNTQGLYGLPEFKQDFWEKKNHISFITSCGGYNLIQSK